MKANILNLVLQRIAQGYEEQFPHYEAMLKLALEQETELQKEELDIDLLVEIINKRQEIIDLIEEQSANMNQLKEEVCKTLGIERFVLSEIKEKVDSQGIQELDQVVGELSQLLQKIRALDQKNEEMLRQRINETKAKLTAVQNTKKANAVSYTHLDVYKRQGVDGVATSIDIQTDTDTIVNNIKAFVDLYNEVLTALDSKITEPRYRDYQPLTSEEKDAMKEADIEKWEEKARSGLLRLSLIHI